MRLLNLNKYFYLIIYLFIFPTYLLAEEPVDIWKKDNKKNEDKIQLETSSENNNSIDIKKKKNLVNITIDEEFSINDSDEKIYGIIDPEENNLTLNMWRNTDGKQIKATFKRLNKLQLSDVAEEIFISTILTNSYLPKRI